MELHPVTVELLTSSPNSSTELNSAICNLVSKYIKPDGCCEKLKWLLYRVKEAITGLFGCSDLQKLKIYYREDFKKIGIAEGIRVGAIKPSAVQLHIAETNKVLEQLCVDTVTLACKIDKTAREKRWTVDQLKRQDPAMYPEFDSMLQKEIKSSIDALNKIMEAIENASNPPSNPSTQTFSSLNPPSPSAPAAP